MFVHLYSVSTLLQRVLLTAQVVLVLAVAALAIPANMAAENDVQQLLLQQQKARFQQHRDRQVMASQVVLCEDEPALAVEASYHGFGGAGMRAVRTIQGLGGIGVLRFGGLRPLAAPAGPLAVKPVARAAAHGGRSPPASNPLG